MARWPDGPTLFWPDGPGLGRKMRPDSRAWVADFGVGLFAGPARPDNMPRYTSDPSKLIRTVFFLLREDASARCDVINPNDLLTDVAQRLARRRAVHRSCPLPTRTAGLNGD
jgi:hypothetical protein